MRSMFMSVLLVAAVLGWSAYADGPNWPPRDGSADGGRRPGDHGPGGSNGPGGGFGGGEDHGGGGFGGGHGGGGFGGGHGGGGHGGHHPYPSPYPGPHPGPRPGPYPGPGFNLCQGTYFGAYSNGAQASLTFSPAGWNRVNVAIQLQNGFVFQGYGTCSSYGSTAQFEFYISGYGMNNVYNRGQISTNGFQTQLSGSQVGGLFYNMAR